MTFWNSLRFKMPITVLLGTIPPMLGAIFYATYRADIQLRINAENNIAEQVELLAESTSWWNQMNVTSLKQLSIQPDILTMNPQRQKAILETFIASNENLYLATTVDLDGTSIARSDVGKPIDYGDRSWFLEAKVGKDISYQTLISRTIGKPAMCMGRPIRKQKSAVLGVVVMCSELSKLARQIGDLEFGQTGYAILVDNTGQVLAHPNSALLAGSGLHNLHNYPPVKNTLEGREGLFSFVNAQGDAWVSYGKALENGWKIVMVQQRDELYQTETELKKLVSLVAVVAVMTVSFLTWLLANYLTRPITKLTTTSLALAQGKLDERIEVNRLDELGILGQSFNRMAKQLKNSFTELETKVRKRTSELNKAKEAAITANKTKDRFLARISHDLRSPLNTIISYADLLQAKPDLSTNHVDTQKQLKIIQNSGVHLLNLIEDILNFSKAEANKLELNPTYFNWQSFLDKLMEMIELNAEKKQLIIKSQIEGELSTDVFADEKRLQQVLLNLLNNAIKFTDRGSITLKLTVLNDIEVKDNIHQYNQQKVRFEVIDTGIGIDEKDLAKIFLPFEQVGRLENQVGGSGLGLSICQEIVNLMGGELFVQSKLGIGSVFWFDLTLPVVNSIVETQENKTAELETQESKNTKLLTGDSSKPKIIIVDDKEEYFLVLEKFLEPLGFQVFSFSNAEKALTLAAFIEPDMFIVDLYMPIKTGFTLVRDLQSVPELADIPVILMSSVNEEVLKKACFNFNCQGYLTKPIEEKYLLRILRRFGLLSELSQLS